MDFCRHRFAGPEGEFGADMLTPEQFILFNVAVLDYLCIHEIEIYYA